MDQVIKRFKELQHCSMNDYPFNKHIKLESSGDKLEFINCYYEIVEDYLIVVPEHFPAFFQHLDDIELEVVE